MILISEEELNALRNPPRDERLADLVLGIQEADRYAGNLERALERVAVVARLARRGGVTSSDYADAMDVIEGLCKVRDDRRSIGAGTTWALTPPEPSREAV